MQIEGKFEEVFGVYFGLRVWFSKKQYYTHILCYMTYWFHFGLIATCILRINLNLNSLLKLNFFKNVLSLFADKTGEMSHFCWKHFSEVTN